MNMRTEHFDMTMQTGNFSTPIGWTPYSFWLCVNYNMKAINYSAK